MKLTIWGVNEVNRTIRHTGSFTLTLDLLLQVPFAAPLIAEDAFKAVSSDRVCVCVCVDSESPR